MTIDINAELVGGAIGAGSETNIVDNVYWDTNLSNIYVSQGGTGLNTLTMKTPDFWLNQSFESHIWELQKGRYPTLKQQCK